MWYSYMIKIEATIQYFTNTISIEKQRDDYIFISWNANNGKTTVYLNGIFVDFFIILESVDKLMWLQIVILTAPQFKHQPELRETMVREKRCITVTRIPVQVSLLNMINYVIFAETIQILSSFINICFFGVFVNFKLNITHIGYLP